jgi:hypothetical protein
VNRFRPPTHCDPAPDAARSCRRIDELLPTFAGGELDVRSVAEVFAHLRGCERCRAEAAAFHGVRERLAALEAQAAPPRFFDDLHASILARVAASSDAPRRRGIAATVRRFVRRPVWAGVAAVLVVAGISYAIRLATPGPGDLLDPDGRTWSVDGATTRGIDPATRLRPLGYRSLPIDPTDQTSTRADAKWPRSEAQWQGLRGRGALLRRLVHPSAEIDVDDTSLVREPASSPDTRSSTR